VKCRWGLRCIGLLLLALPLWAMAATRVALVVGNNAYQYGGVLANAIGDADKIGNALEQLGFQVIRKQNLTYAGLLSALDELGKAAMGADWVVVYYAGHAVQIAGKNHLVPVDVGLHREGDLRRTAKLDDLLTEVNQARELGLVILDACRDNPFAARLNQGRSVAGRGLARVGDTGGSNTLVAFATAEDTIATDSGVYASVLAEHLKETPGLEVRQLFGKVRDAVMERTKSSQKPYVYGSLGGGSYAFKPAPSTPPVPPADSSNSLELAFWSSIKDSRNAADYRAYLKRYPQGTFNDLAQNRLADLTEYAKPTQPAAPPPAAPAPPPAPTLINNRYRDNGDGTVIDMQTNLHWMRCALGQTWKKGNCTGEAGEYKWQQALDAAKGFNYAGYRDWRVPSREELTGLVVCSNGRYEIDDQEAGTHSCQGNYSSPTIDITAFPNTPTSYFWSASPDAGYSDGAWGVYFGNGYNYWNHRRYAGHVRLVRAGQ